MPFIWNNWSTNISTGSPISATSIDELRNNIDYCDDNTGCTSHCSTHHLDHNGSQFANHFSGHDGADDSSVFTGNFASHNGAKDSTYNSTNLVTYENAVNIGVLGGNYSGRQSSPYYSGNDAGKYGYCSSNYTSNYTSNYPNYQAAPYCYNAWNPNWNGHYNGKLGTYRSGEAV